jgi:monoterpene epsilon-lactone hydrolase
MHRRTGLLATIIVAAIALSGCQAAVPRPVTTHAAAAAIVTKPKVERFTSSSNADALQILYIHGGSYLHEASAFHAALIDDLLPQIGATVDMPVYPLAPAHTFGEAYAQVLDVYTRLTEADPHRPIAIMGDSAGGGFALGLAEVLAATDLPQPCAIVLISPWLDLTLSNPAISAIDKTDVILNRSSLAAAGLAWAGGTDPKDFRLSPINGTLTGLPPVTVVVGTHDILYPDVVRLDSLAEASGADVDVHVYRGGDHRFASSETPDGVAARAVIVKALLRGSAG